MIMVEGYCHECNELVICTTENQVAENVYECDCGYPNHISQLCPTKSKIIPTNILNGDVN